LTDRDRSGQIHSPSAAAIPKAVTIARIGGHLRRNTHLRDLRLLPRAWLRLESSVVSIPVSYRASWSDGFGARGWKLNANLDDPQIIAATSDASGAIPTSVLVHDMLDHLLCGFVPSGHRAEAMALEQLARRTGSDPTPDYRQMVREDLFAGQVVGEPMVRFIGASPAFPTHAAPS